MTALLTGRSSSAWSLSIYLPLPKRQRSNSHGRLWLDGIITTSNPSYPAKYLKTATYSSLGFDYNAPVVLGQIEQALADYRATGVAAVQVDVVAHSMGGLITRRAKRLPRFTEPVIYGEGFINRLITIGTPHWGTPLATQVLQSANSCVRDILARYERLSLVTATVGGATQNGAVGDLQGDGWGGGLSTALSSLQMGGGTPLRTAFVFGTATSTNLSSLDSSWAARLIRLRCRWNGDPLATNLTSQGWPAVFGQASDVVVSRNSQLAGINGTELLSTIHSSGMTELGFMGPSELDTAGGGPTEIIRLLNLSRQAAAYNPLP